MYCSLRKLFGPLPSVLLSLFLLPVLVLIMLVFSSSLLSPKGKIRLFYLLFWGNIIWFAFINGLLLYLVPIYLYVSFDCKFVAYAFWLFSLFKLILLFIILNPL